MEACLQKGQELNVAQFPVVEEGAVVGLISASEIFALAAHFLGAFERRSGVTLGPMTLQPGVIGRVTDLVEGCGAEVVAIYPINAGKPPSPQKKLIVRFHGSAHAVSCALEAAGYSVIEAVENAKVCTRAAA
jgi:acetoin utilization protein AcuB